MALRQTSKKGFKQPELTELDGLNKERRRKPQRRDERGEEALKILAVCEYFALLQCNERKGRKGTANKR